MDSKLIRSSLPGSSIRNCCLIVAASCFAIGGVGYLAKFLGLPISDWTSMIYVGMLYLTFYLLSGVGQLIGGRGDNERDNTDSMFNNDIQSLESLHGLGKESAVEPTATVRTISR